ncbi:hypothetical protein GQX74_003855 [Glossina fuscipes]|nr:hypothetical protein GQX74_003855 [Glossina fuscipes]
MHTHARTLVTTKAVTRGRKPSAKLSKINVTSIVHSPRQVANSAISPAAATASGPGIGASATHVPHPSPNTTSATATNLLANKHMMPNPKITENDTTIAHNS